MRGNPEGIQVASTGVTVRRIVQWYKQGFQPEEFANRIGHLTLAQVHAGPAYDPANREAIEAGLAAEQETVEQLKQDARPARS